jgi:monoamine oxidase
VRTPGYLIDGEYFSATDLATKQPATAEALKRYEKTLDDLARSIDDPLNPAANSTLFALDQINVSTWLDKLQPAGHRASVGQPADPHPLRRTVAPVAAVFRPAEPCVPQCQRP